MTLLIFSAKAVSGPAATRSFQTSNSIMFTECDSQEDADNIRSLDEIYRSRSAGYFHKVIGSGRCMASFDYNYHVSIMLRKEYAAVRCGVYLC